MSQSTILESLYQARVKGEKRLALLIDPDNTPSAALEHLLELANSTSIDFFFVGGSLMLHEHLDDCLLRIRRHGVAPSVIFPGSVYQISPHADAILFLSLISGRNAELLIGQQVLAAPYLKRAKLEVLPTGYLLVDGGAPTTVSYMSHTLPIPADKPEIAAITALAGEMLGLRLMFLDAGSGARRPVTESMIAAVAAEIKAPLIVGGGIRYPEQAQAALRAGANLVVVGNAAEKDPGLILEMAEAVHSL
jgi:phosphoglycerol geranylgeranyltransferase